MSDEKMLAHYSAALDEIYRLRSLLAYEAEVLSVHLTFMGFPKSRRPVAETQVKRMRQAACGCSEHTYVKIPPANMAFVRTVAGMEPTLTRGQWEVSRGVVTGSALAQRRERESGVTATG